MSDPAQPSVSVISAFFNEERFLAEAIESVLGQSLSDIELLLVDDGSTDRSRSIVEEYAARDPRVRVFEHGDHANLGLSASRNLGISMARAPYLAFIDGDDRWPSDKLVEQIAIMRQHPDVALLAGAARYWRSWAGGVDEVRQVGTKRDCVIHPPEALLSTYPLGRAEAPGTTGFMVRADAMQRIGGFEASFPGMYEDQVFLVKMYLNECVYFSHRCWFNYRQHETSMLASSLRDGEYLDVRAKFFSWLTTYLETKDVGFDVRLRVASCKVRLRMAFLRKAIGGILRTSRRQC